MIGAKAALASIVLTFGCATAAKILPLPPREQARGAVAGMAWGVQEATAACGDVILAEHHAGKTTIAKRHLAQCRAAWNAAKTALLVAQDAVDAWEMASANTAACAAFQALDALESTVAAVREGGGVLSESAVKQIDDARALAAFLIKISGGKANQCPIVKIEPERPPTEDGVHE